VIQHLAGRTCMARVPRRGADEDLQSLRRWTMDAGLIGLGNMGSGIAKSLLRGGHRLTVYNRTRSRAEALRGDGATVAASVAEACRGEAVLTMLADDAAVESMVFGDAGILASVSRGGLHISLSTISVALSDRLAAE